MKMHWKVLIGILTVTLPPLFTYLAAHAEASEASIRAEVAYATWQDAVKELQDESYRHALELAEIKGELKAERHGRAECLAAASPKPLVSLPTPLKLDNDGVPDQPQVKMRPKPPSFNEAVQSFKAKK